MGSRYDIFLVYHNLTNQIFRTKLLTTLNLSPEVKPRPQPLPLELQVSCHQLLALHQLAQKTSRRAEKSDRECDYVIITTSSLYGKNLRW
jgi:hypothetical protein